VGPWARARQPRTRAKDCQQRGACPLRNSVDAVVVTEGSRPCVASFQDSGLCCGLWSLEGSLAPAAAALLMTSS